MVQNMWTMRYVVFKSKERTVAIPEKKPWIKPTIRRIDPTDYVLAQFGFTRESYDERYDAKSAIDEWEFRAKFATRR